MRDIALCLASATLAAAAPAAAQSVKLFANQSHLTATSPTGNSALVQVTVGPYATDALILVSAQGRSHYSGPKSNRGIVVEIVANGMVASDDSFEGESSNMPFRAAASHSFLLKGGTSRVVTARTLPLGAAAPTDTQTSVSMDLAAISVSP